MARTKYTEIPNDENAHFTFISVNDKKRTNRSDEKTSSSETLSGIAYEAPLLGDSAEETSPTAVSCVSCHRHRRKSSDTILRHGHGGGGGGGCSSTLKHRQRKSHSLPSSCSLNSIGGVGVTGNSDVMSDESIVLRISAEDFASQLTLGDLTVFAKITPDELTSCAWNKRNKLEITPNIVAFTKRFNQVSFWTVEEVLKGSTCKIRAEILSHYVRICKKLYDLNNFHSLFAIVSALRSASIYRLTRSWYYVSKKDKQLFEKLTAVFSEEDNWKNLRERVEKLKLPCIPYLGMFLTDIVYVNMAHPHTGGLETEQRRFKMNNILRVIAHLQQSQYDLPVLDDVRAYLNSVNYIEELQKFIEDDQYKLSLKLEPPTAANGFYDTKNLCANGGNQSSGITETVASLNLSPAKLHNHKYAVGHRKCFSLEPCMLKTLPLDNSRAPSRHLLDDSVLEDSGGSGSGSVCEDDGGFRRNGFLSKISIDRYVRDSSYSNCYGNSGGGAVQWKQTIILEGCLKRKIVFKNGCHPVVSSWHRFWVQVSPNSLIFYSPKCFKGFTRNDFKKYPCKIWSIEDCIITLGENPDVFFFKDTRRSKLYKFRAINDSVALKWYRTLYNAAEGRREEINPSNLISFE